MFQQYLNQAQSNLKYLDSKALNELLSDDEKLEQMINEVVSIVLERNRQQCQIQT
jgi:hypothetical protein